MKKLNQSILIHAPREVIWEKMFSDEGYRRWTKTFNNNSHFEGSWEEGEKIVFLGNDDKGGEGGMVARIKESRPPEFISIEHYGMINNGVEDTTSDAVKAWAPAHENYTLTETDEGTKFVVDMDIEDEWEEMFNDMWPKALLALKEMCEEE